MEKGGGKKKFAVKDAIIYGSIAKEEKKVTACGRKYSDSFNLFRSQLASLS